MLLLIEIKHMEYTYLLFIKLTKFKSKGSKLTFIIAYGFSTIL